MMDPRHHALMRIASGMSADDESCDFDDEYTEHAELPAGESASMRDITAAMSRHAMPEQFYDKPGMSPTQRDTQARLFQEDDRGRYVRGPEGRYLR